MVLPDLTERQRNKVEGYEFRLKRDFPALDYDRFAFIPQCARIILQDVDGVSDQFLDEFASLLNGDTYVYSQRGIVKALEEKLGGLIQPSRSIACLFPGQGAKSILQMMDRRVLEGCEVISFDIGRRVSPNGIVTGVTTNLQEICFRQEPELVVVIDDVIATGSTAARVRDICEAPNAEYIAFPLLTLSPIQNRYWENQNDWGNQSKAGVRRYDRIVTSLVYQGESGIPPVNSLSTLISNSPKGSLVRESFARKHAQDQAGFLQVLSKLQVAYQ